MSIGEYEDVGVYYGASPKMLPRKYPIKIVYMATIGCPIPHRNFCRRIHIVRVSKEKSTQKCTAHIYVSDDAVINSKIKITSGGPW